MKGAKSTHPPIMNGECTKCHSPHKSKLAKLLLSPSPDLCLTCHKGTKEKLAKETPHPPAQKNCQTSHLPHFSAEPSLLAEPQKSLCSECHDLKAAPFTKEHLGIDPGQMNCMSCHNPHASKDPKFFKEDIHPPFAARSCDECHIVEKR